MPPLIGVPEAAGNVPNAPVVVLAVFDPPEEAAPQAVSASDPAAIATMARRLRRRIDRCMGHGLPGSALGGGADRRTTDVDGLPYGPAIDNNLDTTNPLLLQIRYLLFLQHAGD